MFVCFSMMLMAQVNFESSLLGMVSSTHPSENVVAVNITVRTAYQTDFLGAYDAFHNCTIRSISAGVIVSMPCISHS